VAGFYFLPLTYPGPNPKPVWVTCDEWSSTVSDRTAGGVMLGQLTTEFVRSFTPLAGGPAVTPSIRRGA
jgi:hypothetical protein